MTVGLSETLPTQWKRLQNGSDIRGVALEGVTGEAVNLTPEIAYRLGQGFVSWLAKKLDKNSSDLVVSVGRDSRLSGPALKDGLAEGMMSLGAKVLDVAIASTPSHVHEHRHRRLQLRRCHHAHRQPFTL